MKRTLRLACTAAAAVSMIAAAGCAGPSTGDAAPLGTRSAGPRIDLPLALCVAAHGHDHTDPGYADRLSRDARVRHAHTLATCEATVAAPSGEGRGHRLPQDSLGLSGRSAAYP
ncbi:hypothetical protein [Streptomyces sp. NPDC047525]|uniref:hypothetical protein n=1 Tax=Streptomyces sp. NPDC047525 TaxID=3155264 RepID=UPI0033D1D68B